MLVLHGQSASCTPGRLRTAFVRTVISRITVCIIEEKGAEEGRGTEYGLALMSEIV